jgi:nicotinate-nucleotide--dimethylbenzimidazole phosphoribosyltransferase
MTHLLVITQAVQGRHRDVTDPVEVLAAFGGFEIAMMVGVMLVAASRRHLIMVDGLPACAALMVAARIAAPVTDYCVFCRSHGHNGLDYAMNLFHTSALLELGLESSDGTGATLAWPLVRAAAALLTEVAEGEDPGPSRPGNIDSQLGEPGASQG